MATLEPLLPEKTGAEYNFLVLILRSKGTANRAIQFLRPEDFSSTAHQVIFSVVQQIVSEERALDFASLVHGLKEQELTDQAGGEGYLATLERSITGPEPFFTYELASDLIKKAALARKLIRLAVDLIHKSFLPHCDALDLLRETASEVNALLKEHGG